jgi:hypothetical protein
VNRLKKILKNINYLNIAKLLVVTVLVFAPLFSAVSVDAAGLGLRPNIDCPPGLKCGETSINQLISTIIDWMLGIAFGVAVLFLIIGGFWYITSAGNEETAEKGKNTAINAIIGIVIIILSYVIVNVVTNLISGRSTGAP